MLAALRAGTAGIAPFAQTQAPSKSWHLESETRKSAGGVGVSHPNNAGGIGDRSGVIMLDRVLADPSFAARSSERLVHETNLRPTSGDEGYH
jgi:hypothetical protein